LKQSYEKFIRLELLALSLMLIIGIIALVKKSTFLILFCLFLLGFSLLFEGLKKYHTYEQMEAVKHMVKAIMVVMFAIYLLFSNLLMSFFPTTALKMLHNRIPHQEPSN